MIKLELVYVLMGIMMAGVAIVNLRDRASEIVDREHALRRQGFDKRAGGVR